jgi:threonylcarbamoyladenosine tRNA methylthiotransferase MtaB
MHENSVRLVEDCDIVIGHIFPFSPKRGTPAARMPQVPVPVVKERARRLREACAGRWAAWLEGLVGTRQRVLMEKGGRGHSENFAPVRLRHPGESRDLGETHRDFSTRGPGFRRDDGEVVDVAITHVENDSLVGIPA